MKHLSQKSLGVILALTFSCFVPSLASDAPQYGIPVNSTREAIAAVVAYTGIGDTEYVTTSQQRSEPCVVRYEDDRTPFVHKLINSRPVWLVRFDSVVFSANAWGSRVSGQKIKSYSILLDSISGAILRIFTGPRTYDTSEYDLPIVSEVESELGYVDIVSPIPSASPQIPFFQVLRGAIGSDPLMADEIDALYLMMLLPGREEREPMWSIIGKGIVFEFIGSSGYHDTRGRTIVDATTGNPLILDNSPGHREKQKKKGNH